MSLLILSCGIYVNVCMYLIIFSMIRYCMLLKINVYMHLSKNPASVALLGSVERADNDS